MTDPRTALAATLAAERLRIVASLIRTTRSWDLAEDALADAAERALLRWPVDGVPTNPAAWLTTVARRRALDLGRRAATEQHLLGELASDPTRDPAGGDSDGDRLRLIFTCCHPALSLESRVALTLTVVAGLPTDAVAQAFLTSPATMSQRLLRAKQRIATAGIPYAVPGPDAFGERLDGVLAVVYLVFTEGYATQEVGLAEEALRLGRLLVELVPGADEARALLALMLLQHSRHATRLVEGELVRLEDQDRSRWDAGAIAEARRLLARPTAARGPYRVQAELAAVHARAPSGAATDWAGIVRLYDELLDRGPSPVAALNRAVALGMSESAAAGLRALEEARTDPALRDHPLVPAVRGDLLARAGRSADAVVALDEAARLTLNDRERRALRRRRDEIAGDVPS